MKKLELNQILSVKELKNMKFIKGYTDEKKYIRVGILDDVKYLIQRIGNCEPTKCDSICCRSIHISSNSDYYKGFGDKGKYSGRIININCKFLCKNHTCKKWGEKLPTTCKTFPHPEDEMYWEVSDKCSFKFKVIKTNIKMKKQ